MHPNILDTNQELLLPLLSKFKKEFFLVGGTAIALQIGHRMSIDFDLFKVGSIRPKNILSKFEKIKGAYKVTYSAKEQLNLICKDVKFTFFDFEFDVPHLVKFKEYITMPNLLELAAMKAYALGRRSKWKDYVDLYFIIKDHYSIAEISKKAIEIFGELFSEKLFRGQLSYFTGISFEEQVIFIPSFEVDENTVKVFLTNAALNGF